MPTPLTDAQKRTDESFDQLMLRWNQLPDAVKTSGSGAAVKEQLVDLVRRRNGDAAAAQFGHVLAHNSIPLSPAMIRGDVDDQFPRIDTSSAASGPSGARPPAPAPVPVIAPGRSSARNWLPSRAELPGIGDKDNGVLDTLDKALEAHNAALFDVNPALAKIPGGAQLPVTGTNISTLGGTYDMASAVIPKWRAAIEALNTSLRGSGEHVITEQLDRLRDTLRATTAAADQSQGLNRLVATAGVAANDTFHQLRGEALDKNRTVAAIYQIAAQARRSGLRVQGDPYARISPVTAHLTASDDAVQKGRDITALAAKLPAAPSISAVSAPTPTSGAPADESTHAGSAKSPAPTSGAATPAHRSGAPGRGAPGSATAGGGDDLSKLLSALGQAGAPMMPNPAEAMAPLAQAAQRAAKPLAEAAEPLRQAKIPDDLLKSLRGEAPTNKRLAGSTPAAEAADADRAAATAQTAVLPGPANAAGLGTPGSDARPHQLDAHGRPVDKDGDGKVDKDAVPLNKKTVKPFDLAVPVHGKNVQVHGVTDPRLGEMMLNMADAGADKPVSVLDAAKASGMDISSLGAPRDPGQAHVGDAVVGAERSGIYLGDGHVLTSTGEVASLDDVVGDDGFVASVPLPDLPADTAGAGGDTPAEPLAPVAHHAAAQDVTPAAGPPPETPPAAPEPQPTPAPVSPAPVSPASSSAQHGAGQPRQVPYEGRALG